MRRFRDFLVFPIALGTAALIVFTASCGSPSGPEPIGRLVSRTDCKSAGGAAVRVAGAPSSSQECIEYDYDGRGVLRLRHINAGFNCCPGTISADIEISDGELRITESESSSLCDCNCLYDLGYEMTRLTSGTWRISIAGPYQPEGGPPLEVLVDLSQASSGSYCVERTVYPWGY